MCLSFGGCADGGKIDKEKEFVVKQQIYSIHNGLSSVSNDSVVFNYKNDNSGKATMNNLSFSFEIVNDNVYLVFDKICDGLSDYDSTMANAEKASLDVRRTQIEYDASLLKSHGKTEAAKNKLASTEYDYKYIKNDNYLVNSEKYIDTFIEYSNNNFLNGRACIGNDEYVFSSNGDFIKTYLTAGTFKSTDYGKYELKNGMIHIIIDKTIREIQGKETEINSSIKTVGYFEEGKLFYDILVLKE